MGEWRNHVARFYREYYFEKQRNMQDFMNMNGINLMVVSHFFWCREKESISDRAFRLSTDTRFPGSPSQSEKPATGWKCFKDFERLKLMSQDALARSSGPNRKIRIARFTVCLRILQNNGPGQNNL